MRRYLIYWWKISALSLQSSITTRLSSLLFIIGKFARFGLFAGFLLALQRSITDLAGYSFRELVVFFLIYNFFDLIGQLFYRGIYWFRDEIISGDFDFRLVKPINPLFQIMTSNTDFLDVPLLILVSALLVINWPGLPISQNLIFIAVSLLAVLVLTAIHIFVASIGILTTSVDHAIWMFRDFAALARVPLDIYVNPLRIFLTYIVPIGLIFTVPAKILFGQYSLPFLTAAFLLGLGFYLLSLRVWRYALTRYASASS